MVNNIFKREAQWMAGTIVAVVVIGLLAALFIPSFSSWRQKKAIERCQQSGGEYDGRTGKCSIIKQKN